MCTESHVYGRQASHEAVDAPGGIVVAEVGDVQVDHGIYQRGVAEVLLDDADVHAGFEQVCGIGMPQRMDRCMLLDLRQLLENLTHGPLHRAHRHWLEGRRSLIAPSSKGWKSSRGLRCVNQYSRSSGSVASGSGGLFMNILLTNNHLVFFTTP
jgi:hypothetical protein